MDIQKMGEFCCGYWPSYRIV